MAISATRLRILLDEQTAIAKKVFGAVPINESWTSKAIATEISRSTGSHCDFNVIQGCLDSLKRIGLVKESSPGYFQRVKTRKEEPPMATTTSTPQTVKAVKSPTDLLGEYAAAMRTFIKMAEGIATDLEELAMTIEDSQNSNDEELKKLRALKEALGAFAK